MARYLIPLLFFITFINSCENLDISKKYIPSYKQIAINVVEKNIIDKSFFENSYDKLLQEHLIKWLENNIKTDGFEGKVDIRLVSISSQENQIQNGFQLNISSVIEFTISKSILDSKKIITISGSEYGEITGDFSMNDKSVEIENIIKKLIEKMSHELFDKLN
ncbi:hypothetical protein N9751_01050 [Alphaproteobacteria bacterium]|nr:hypothetical protein [Alphaproteobacteria bacterium]MDB9825038.1 hypothetical protein [Alphaproteobacteria bacterium]